MDNEHKEEDENKFHTRPMNLLYTIYHLAIVTGTIIIGLYIIETFDIISFNIAIYSVLVWEMKLQYHFFKYAKHCVGVLSPLLAFNMSEIE